MHKKKIISNSIISIMYKLIMLILGFVTRKIFIVYLGEEVLGLNSLYANLLDLLNLADLGIGIALQFQLYEPLVKKDYQKLSKVLSAAKKLYNSIGFFILSAGFVLSFFIQYLIKSNAFPIWFIRIAFLISTSGVALGYFFVHKRLFLQANEEIGVVNIIDLTAKIVTVFVSLITTVIWKNYFIYLVINALYGLTGNTIIYFIFKKKYPLIRENIKDTSSEVKELTGHLKNVIPMKLSNYVYNSTDNVVISKILGLSSVALYSNYMTIINGIMGIEYLIGNVMTSSIGKIINESQDNDRVFKYYLVFQYIQYMFTAFALISLLIICEPFIKLWIGEEYLISSVTFVLLLCDFYIHSMYQPAYVMFGASGKFKDDKYITLASAIMNIVISVILVMIIGLPGVIVGTLVTDIYIWIVRTYQVVKKYYKKSLLGYSVKMIKYTVCCLIGLVSTFFISKLIVTNSILIELLLKLLICIIVPNLINLILTFRSDEFKYLRSNILKIKKR